MDPLRLRPYQIPVFEDRQSGIVVLHWSRQIGKSFTLAAWAIDRLITRPGRLVTVLSNSRENGAEFLAKCAEVCRLLDREFESTNKSRTLSFKDMRMEIKIRAEGKTGRIKVLAANPRTARGFSGDLILDEFAFHENSDAIWEAAEPILASNRDFLCRIASTGNGRHNLFHQFAAPVVTSSANANALPRGGICLSFARAGHVLSRVTRTQAHWLGVPIYDPNTRETISPETARARAVDKRAYDQNYECAFADENLALLSHDPIAGAEQDGIGFICEQDWSPSVLARLRSAVGPLYVGFDVGRKIDLSVITVIEALPELKIVRAILRIRDMRLPDQQSRLGEICRLPKFRRAAIDMTGLGLGLFEYAQKQFGSRIQGINFASTVPATRAIQSEGRHHETVRVTEALALELLQAYESRQFRHPCDPALREDLRKPERVTSPGGRVSIAATRDEAGHADHFWSFAFGSRSGRDFLSPIRLPALNPSLPHSGHPDLIIVLVIVVVLGCFPFPEKTKSRALRPALQLSFVVSACYFTSKARSISRIASSTCSWILF
jgi:phage FluMu gp28-like protein